MHPELHQKLSKLFGDRLRLAASLKPLNSMRVGGEADALVLPRHVEEVQAVIAACHQTATPFRVVGGGTNLLVPDSGFRGVVLLTTGQMTRYGIEEAASPTPLLFSDAGVRISRLLSFCLENQLSGLEFAAGIPGTFGGVLWMNAGTKAGWVSSVFHSLQLVTKEGELKTLGREDIHFTYRSANLPKGSIILNGKLMLNRGERATIAAEIAKVKSYRQNQPLEWPNSGSIFKNPPHDHAGRLIEATGLKGHRQGGAMISDKHANFIVNVGNATASDVMALIALVQEKVLAKHGVRLEPEVEVLQ